MRLASAIFAFSIFVLWPWAASAQQPVPNQWAAAWPATDFARASVDFRTIISGGVPKDGSGPLMIRCSPRLATSTPWRAPSQ